MRVLLDSLSELWYRLGLKVRVAVCSAEGQVNLRSVPKRTFHLSEDLRGTLFIVKIETCNSQIIAVREGWIECERSLQFLPGLAVLIELQERTPKQLVGFREPLTVRRIPPNELSRECLCMGNVAHGQRSPRIVQKQCRRRLKAQSFIKERSGAHIVRHHRVPSRELAQCFGEERAVLPSCLAELADPLKFLGLIEYLLESPFAIGSEVSGLPQKSRCRDQR